MRKAAQNHLDIWLETEIYQKRHKYVIPDTD